MNGWARGSRDRAAGVARDFPGGNTARRRRPSAGALMTPGPVSRLVRVGGVSLLVGVSLLPSIRETGSTSLAEGVRRLSSTRAASTTSTSTTLVAPTTTTAQPTPPPPPPPPPTPPPASEPRADGDPGIGNLLARAQAALDSAVPSRLRALFPVRLEIISGRTSLSGADGRVQLSEYHARGVWSHLRAVTAHEWGHQTAFRQGSHAYFGAPPEGWPYDGRRPEEAWADCVAVSLIGINPTGDAAACTGPTIQFVDDWLATR
jgi:hypothetical protein